MKLNLIITLTLSLLTCVASAERSKDSKSLFCNLKAIAATNDNPGKEKESELYQATVNLLTALGIENTTHSVRSPLAEFVVVIEPRGSHIANQHAAVRKTEGIAYYFLPSLFHPNNLDFHQNMETLGMIENIEEKLKKFTGADIVIPLPYTILESDSHIAQFFARKNEVKAVDEKPVEETVAEEKIPRVSLAEWMKSYLDSKDQTFQKPHRKELHKKSLRDAYNYFGLRENASLADIEIAYMNKGAEIFAKYRGNLVKSTDEKGQRIFGYSKDFHIDEEPQYRQEMANLEKQRFNVLYEAN